MLERIAEQIAKVLQVPLEQVSVTVPEVSDFGHYSTNIAMRVAAATKLANVPASGGEAKKSPFELAQEFAVKLKSEMFSKVEAVKPGFINFWISEKFLLEQFELFNPRTHLKIGEGKTVIVEYSAPNIAKPMHVGHLRSTIIGDALANIYEYLGYKVIRWNYFGDWGTQFGKLIAAYKRWGDKKAVEKDPIGELLKLYIRFHEEEKRNAELEKEGQAEFKKLEEGDKENRKLWEWFKDESLAAFKKTYKRLDVTFDIEIGEAHYEEALGDVIKQLREKELLTPSEGSYIVNLEKFNLPPALIQKSDGASLYITRDIATLEHRLSRYKPDKILYVVANQQSLHFEQLFAIAKLLGLTEGVQLEHIKFGMVLGEDGKKLATREGKLIELQEVMDKVTGMVFETVKKNNPDLTEQGHRQIAEVIGIGALKYNDLKENRNSDITFNWERMLDVHGDSAPYLQYTSRRLANIVQKNAAEKIKSGDDSDLNIYNLKELTLDIEKQLIKKTLDFKDVVILSVSTAFTSHLAKYLLNLAKLANQYYESVRILEDQNRARRDGRLLLISSVAGTIEKGLGLLGIKVPPRI